jgi:hypothetical protein
MAIGNTPPPQTPADEHLAKTTKGCGTALGVGLLLLFLLFLWGKVSTNENPAYVSKDVMVDDAPTTMPTFYTLLNTEHVGNYENLQILLPNVGRDRATISQLAQQVINQECRGRDCNVVSFWRTKAAWESYQYYQAALYGQPDDEAWKKKNWIRVCEELAADYNATVQSLQFDPLMDIQYRDFGGRITRIRPAEQPMTVGGVTE